MLKVEKDVKKRKKKKKNIPARAALPRSPSMISFYSFRVRGDCLQHPANRLIIGERGFSLQIEANLTFASTRLMTLNTKWGNGN